MLLQDVLRESIAILHKSGIDTPALDAGVIICSVLGKEKAFLYAHGEYAVDSASLELINNKIQKRAMGIPLQYITGKQEFMSLTFNVNPHVLIPRQDTEILVEHVINEIREKEIHAPYILDIGTGSGCIVLSILHYVNDCRAIAVDISPDALRTAYVNSKNLGLSDRVKFYCSDLFDELYKLPEQERKFDIIVSNPPYIPASDIEKLDAGVRDFEPILALNGGESGIDFYRKIADQCGKFLKKRGILCVEVGINQAPIVAEIFSKVLTNISIIKDYNNIERVVCGEIN